VTATTVVYLDIDGAVGAEAYGYDPKAESGWLGEWHVRKVGPYNLRYSAELVQAINELAALPGVTVVFASSWEDHAPEFLPVVVGLGERHWPFLTGVECESASWWWKLDAVREDARVRGGDRVLWVDDELANIPEARALADTLGDKNLSISPDPKIGLTVSHLHAMREFILAL
jgi:hypothetical protein